MPDSVFVYLDTNVIVDLYAAINEWWQPADDLSHKSNLQRIAAARLNYYAYERTPPGFSGPWFLVTSKEAVREIDRKSKGERVPGIFHQIELSFDAPTTAEIGTAADSLMVETGITDRDDALHLAHVALHPEVGLLVTGDSNFRKRASRATILGKQIVSTIEAVEMMKIRPGEAPRKVPNFPMPAWLIPT